MNKYDQDVADIVEHVLSQQGPRADGLPQETGLRPRAPKIASEVRTVPLDAPIAKETKTAEKLAQMIEADLAKHPECPAKGFVVTVYGAAHWRAMLMIKPAAGPVRNAREWWDLTSSINSESGPKRAILSRKRSKHVLRWQLCREDKCAEAPIWRALQITDLAMRPRFTFSFDRKDEVGCDCFTSTEASPTACGG
jgi:hypothetical protein